VNQSNLKPVTWRTDLEHIVDDEQLDGLLASNKVIPHRGVEQEQDGAHRHEDCESHEIEQRAGVWISLGDRRSQQGHDAQERAQWNERVE